MKALIDPRAPRVCQVTSDPATFAVAPPLLWLDAPNNCTPSWSVHPDGDGWLLRAPAPSEHHVWDGAAWVLPAGAFDDMKAAGRESVARRAEAERQKYITPGAGKAAVYALKRDEALRWQAEVDGGGAPQLNDYPWIAARANRLGVSGQDVADEWNAKAAAWEAVGRQIEDAYEAAVEAIEALTDAASVEADVQAIIGGVAWP